MVVYNYKLLFNSNFSSLIENTACTSPLRLFMSSRRDRRQLVSTQQQTRCEGGGGAFTNQSSTANGLFICFMSSS